MTSLMDSENGVDREALAAWHEDRRGWSLPTCFACGVRAVSVLRFDWADGRRGRSMPRCAKHRDETVAMIENLRIMAPPAVEGLTYTVEGL